MQNSSSKEEVVLNLSFDLTETILYLLTYLR